MYLKQYHISRQISQNHGRDHSEYVDPAVEREIIFWKSVWIKKYAYSIDCNRQKNTSKHQNVCYEKKSFNS